MARFEEYKDIFVFVEQENGNIAEVSYELISEARKLVASIPEFGYKVVGVLLGENVKEKAQEVISHGADKVIVVDDSFIKRLFNSILCRCFNTSCFSSQTRFNVNWCHSIRT